mmetsp:Transcript_51700/g.167980  ORF Transcript_51700/g.167980 Transcript_51700/m.167980 type:complete len:299 (-) Transcript_51700:1111-2007(-)
MRTHKRSRSNMFVATVAHGTNCGQSDTWKPNPSFKMCFEPRRRRKPSRTDASSSRTRSQMKTSVREANWRIAAAEAPGVHSASRPTTSAASSSVMEASNAPASDTNLTGTARRKSGPAPQLGLHRSAQEGQWRGPASPESSASTAATQSAGGFSSPGAAMSAATAPSRARRSTFARNASAARASVSKEARTSASSGSPKCAAMPTAASKWLRGFFNSDRMYSRTVSAPPSSIDRPTPQCRSPARTDAGSKPLCLLRPKPMAWTTSSLLNTAGAIHAPSSVAKGKPSLEERSESAHAES